MRSLSSRRLAVSVRAALLFGACAAGTLAPRTAAACGGTFCDGGPMPMAVDQKGENILFVMDGQTVEAHIQIQYQGGAARFAWVIPVPTMPSSISVGSQQLFANLLGATVPTYYTQNQSICQQPPCGNGTGFGAGGASGAGGGASGSAGSSGGGGPTVVFSATVGAFDVSVLQGGTSAEVIAWLDANKYQQNPLAQPILDGYLAKGYLFVALRLTGGVGVDEIHPIVVKYAGDKPCVPLKLTAIAASEDMEVRTFFLGKGRVVPTNYKHIVLNQARVDWTAANATFLPAVTNAANEPIANGHGFVTEYAGANIVGSAGLYNPQWDAGAFPGTTPAQALKTLASQGLMECTGGAKCTFHHPLIAGMLHEFLPPPAGVTDAAYYGCLACYAGQGDLSKWDGAAFGKALIERVITPAVHAAELLQASPYVTRLLTTISPAEMTEDPEFHEDDSLPPDGASLYATRQIACNGASAYVLPGGRTIALANNAWPKWSAGMPWAEKIEEYPIGAPPIVLVDNTKKIDAEVAAFTTMEGWPPPQPTCPGTGGTGGTSGTGGTTGKGGASGGGVGGKAGSPGTGLGGASGAGVGAGPGVGGSGTAANGGASAAGATGVGGAVKGTGGGGNAAATGGSAPAAAAPAAAEPSGGTGCAMAAGGTSGFSSFGALALLLATTLRRRRR